MICKCRTHDSLTVPYIQNLNWIIFIGLLNNEVEFKSYRTFAVT